MSTTHDGGSSSPPITDDPWDQVRANRDAYERLADSDLPISEYCRNVLEYLDELEGSDD